MANDDNSSFMGRSALNTVLMVGFAVPGLKLAQEGLQTTAQSKFIARWLGRAGGAAGVGAAIGLFGMDLFEYFNPPQQDPGDSFVTQADVQAELDDLKADLIDALWKARIDDICAELPALNQGFHDLVDSLQKLKVNGEYFSLVATDDLLENTVADIYSYFDHHNPNGLLTVLRGFRNALEIASSDSGKINALQLLERQTRTIGLYALIGSLSVAYLKAAVMWKWGRELLLSCQYDQYQKDTDFWNDQDATYQDTHPFEDLLDSYDEVVANPLYKPPTWEEWKSQPGCPWQLLLDEVQSLLDYCVVTAPATGGKPARSGLYTKMLKNNLDDMEKHAADGDDFPSSTAGIWKQHMKDAFRYGATRVNWLETLQTEYGLEAVSEQDIDNFGKVIALWQATAASVRFTTYTAGPNEMPFDIAKHFYNEVGYAWALLQANPTVALENQFYVPEGSVLKIFDKDALAALVPNRLADLEPPNG